VGGGQCVSACNPACAAGEQCTGQGECLAPTPAVAPPQPTITYSPGAPPPPSDLEHREDELGERRRTGKRYHDGFYLRLGVGAGYLTSKLTQTEETESMGGAHGFTLPVEIAIGGSPTPGFVLGFGSWGINLVDTTHTTGRGDFVQEADASTGGIVMLGPFADVYPAPRAGFHVQFAPCFSYVSSGTSSVLASELTGIGFGGMLGLGYEGWVSDQWGVGVLFRNQLVFAQLTNESSSNVRYNLFGFMPSLLFTATLH
jgi:hypothetical protein